MSSLFGFATRICKYCGKTIANVLDEPLSEKCHKSVNGEHLFVANEKKEQI
jgi:hypothetical protein